MDNPGSVPLPSDTLGPEIVRIVAAVTALSATGVLLRCITRLCLVKRTGIDDALIILAFAFACTLTALTCEQVRYGLGKHIWNVNPADIPMSVKLAWWGITIYNMAITFTKLSLLTQYLRIVVDTRHRTVVLGMMVFVVAYGLELLFAGTFTCVPVNAFWDFTVKGKCLPKIPMWIANAVLNIVTDFIIFILPLPVIKKLNLPYRQKIALCLVFAIGFFACIVSIVRLVTLLQAKDSKDFTYDNVPTGTWSVVEAHTAILCACASTLKPLFSKVAPKLLSSIHIRTASSYPSNRSYQINDRLDQSDHRKGALGNSKGQLNGSQCSVEYPLQPLKGEDGQTKSSYTANDEEFDLER